MKVVGLDLSMTATGMCWSTVGGASVWELVKTKGTSDARLVAIRDRIRERLDYIEPVDLVLIEGFLNKSMSAGITGMVHGAVRSMLIEYGYPYATLPPSSLKKYATGRGGADKRSMSVEAFKRGAVEFSDDNTCDAWWLWVAAGDHLGQPDISLPQVNRDALKSLKIEYPGRS